MKLSLALPRGSVLVFSLIILSLMLVTALTILSSALLDRKASLSTGSSTRSFQVADSAVEDVLYQIYKKDYATMNDLASAIGGTCSSGTISFSTAGGSAKVSFHQDDTATPGTTVPYTACGGTDWREKVVKIHSSGTSGTTSRAVEVAVAASVQGITGGCSVTEGGGAAMLWGKGCSAGAGGGVSYNCLAASAAGYDCGSTASHPSAPVTWCLCVSE